MTIDIQPGDTFTIWTNGAILQYRNGTTRWLGDENWASGSTTSCPDERIVERADAIKVLTLAGHTITETTPPATPVPWPTHAAYHAMSGAIVAAGTEAQCQKYVEPLVGTFCVRPLAPAPLSPAMRSFIEVLANQFEHSRNVRLAAAALLAEGGAK